MGGCTSSSIVDTNYRQDYALDYSKVYSEREIIAKDREFFTSLQLTEKDVGTLFKIFNRVDKVNSGSIEIIELFKYLDIDTTPFTKRSFSVFDSERSGYIDFKDFVISLWNYCTLGKATLSIFAFDIYDRDRSGHIESSEIVRMLKDIYWYDYESNANAMAIQKKIAARGDSLFNVEEFKIFAFQHQALMFPALVSQQKLQKRVISVSFWEKLGNLNHSAIIPCK